MLDNLVTPVVAIAIILGITFPIWFLVLAARLVRHVHHIADAAESLLALYLERGPDTNQEHVLKVYNSTFDR